MKKYEELKEYKVDYNKITALIELIFSSKIQLKSDIGKDFKITEYDYDVLVEDIELSREYCKDFGYELSVFYSKPFDRTFYIRFDKLK